MEISTPLSPAANAWTQKNYVRLSIVVIFALLTSSHAIAAKTHSQAKAKTSQNQKSATIKHQSIRSTSEETAAQRDRRLTRECKGRPNAGACLGYTQR